MKLAYVLYGKYKASFLNYHKRTIAKLSDSYDVSVFLITNEENDGINIAATRVKVTDMTLMQTLYSGLLKIPQVDYFYIVKFNESRRLSPNSESTFCSELVWLLERDRVKFMQKIKDQTTHPNFEHIGFSEASCKEVHEHEAVQPKGIVGEMCVVGNGPLTDLEREHIRNCHKIVRFNDTKNRLPFERCDIHIMRQHHMHHSVTDNYPASYHDGSSSVILVGKNALSTEVLSDYVIERLTYQEPFDSTEYTALGTPMEKFDVFPNCNTTRIAKSTLNNISSHPSLGSIALSVLDAMESVKTLHVYGMNFSFLNSHTKKEKDVLHQCCSKCIIHETEKTRYLPIEDLNIFTILLLTIVLISVVRLLIA